MESRESEAVIILSLISVLVRISGEHHPSETVRPPVPDSEPSGELDLKCLKNWVLNCQGLYTVFRGSGTGLATPGAVFTSMHSLDLDELMAVLDCSERCFQDF